MSSVAKIKKGEKVILCGFTGMKLGVYTVTAADKASLTIEKADGTEIVFDRKTGKQLDPKNPKYANFITEDDGSYVKPERKKKAEPKKKASKKAVVVEDEEEEYEEYIEEDEEEEEVKPKKKATPKKKASKKAVVVEDEEDEEDYEEV